MAVASRPLQPGDMALFIPENLIITLDRVFESEFVGERCHVLHTAGKAVYPELERKCVIEMNV